MDLLSVLFAGLVALAVGATDCSSTTTCKLKLAKVVKNELQKGGELRYSEVCTVKGKKIDLAVTTTSGYTSKKSQKNGLSGQYGQINLDAKTGYDFTFSFYESGSSTAIKLESFYFTMFDIDGWWNKRGIMRQKESMTFSGFKHFSVGSNCELDRQISEKQSTFTATTSGGVQDNPTDPNKLTPQQLSRSVTFLYEAVSSFTARFEILGPSKLGTRNFIFAGESSVSKSCSVPVCRPAGVCNLNFQTLKQSNLGGKGPQAGPKELRYGAVCVASGVTLDLAVTTTSPYFPAKSSKNGINGKYGTVNLMNSKKGDFLFSFYKAGTSDPFKLSSTSFTIFDIDSGHSASAKEIVTAGGYASYTMGNNTELKVEDSGTSLKLTSTTFGTEADNPKDPKALSAQQRARSVTYAFEDASSFPLSFEITGGPVGKGRNLLFAGDSSLNEMCESSKPKTTRLFEEPEDNDMALLEKNTGIVPLMLVALASGLTCFFVGLAVQRRRWSANRNVKAVPLQEIE